VHIRTIGALKCSEDCKFDTSNCHPLAVSDRLCGIPHSSLTRSVCTSMRYWPFLESFCFYWPD